MASAEFSGVGDEASFDRKIGRTIVMEHVEPRSPTGAERQRRESRAPSTNRRFPSGRSVDDSGGP